MSVVRVDRLSVSYRASDKTVLNNLSFEIDHEEVVLLAGPTGSGKSTLAFCLVGIIPHIVDGRVEGFIRVCGRDPRESSPSEMVSHVGFVMQNPENIMLSDIVWHDVSLSLLRRGYFGDIARRKSRDYLRQVDLQAYENCRVSWLSQGQKQRLAIASILALEPELLILDEPLSMLDPVAVNNVLRVLKRLINRSSTTILIIEHRLNPVLSIAGRILLLSHNGKLLLDCAKDDLLRDVHKSRILKNALKPVGSYEDEGNVRYAQSLNNKAWKNKGRCAVEIVNVELTKNGIRILKNVSMSIPSGVIVALVGPNGAGKTHLAQVIAGLEKPSKGMVTINGRNIKLLRRRELIREVTYVEQNPDLQIFTSKVYDEVAFGLKSLRLAKAEIEKRVEKVLRLVNLWDYRNRNPFELSFGQRRLLTIAAALALKPSILILDEVTAGLDVKTLARVIRVIKHLKAKGRTVILITHDMELVTRVAEEIYFMKNGKVLWVGTRREFMDIAGDLWYGRI